MPKVLRRLRRSESLRNLVRETRVHPHDFIYPIFVGEGLSSSQPIESMPGQFRHSLSTLPTLAKEIEQAGVLSVLLFGVPSGKDDRASGAMRKDGVVQQAIRAVKDASPSTIVMTDVCICAYTTHGH